MTTIATSPFHLSMLRKTNTWYTIKDGNWSDPTIWESNGAKRHSYPQAGDDVYINHTVTMDIATIEIRNIYINGTLSAASSIIVNIIVDGDCQVAPNGLINLSGNFHNLILNGYANVIGTSTFNAGIYSTVTYNGVYTQSILNIQYNNLTTQNTGFKFQNSDITVGGTFSPITNYECNIFNLTVNGTSILGIAGNGYTFSKNSSTGSLLFKGAVTFSGLVDLSVGNPNVEFRGGITDIRTFLLNTGSGKFTFSTNNQSISPSAYLGGTWNAPIVIQGAITVTLLNGGSTLQTKSTINGTVSGSTFNNSGILYLNNSTTPMLTGVFNYQYSTISTLGYMFNSAFTLPYTTYANLVLAGTGTKTQAANTTINKTFTNNGSFEFGGYNFTCLGNFTQTGAGALTANSFCNIIVGGILDFDSMGGSSIPDLSIGNPNIELRGGLNFHTQTIYTGTGLWKFTTNNQNISGGIINGGAFNCTMLINGPITVTNTNAVGTLPSVTPTGTLNGDNSASTFINLAYWGHGNSQQPMQTGILNCDSAANTFYYTNGNQDITPGTYRNLTLTSPYGFTGVKKLLGNVSVANTYTVISPASLNSNGFVLTNP